MGVSSCSRVGVAGFWRVFAARCAADNQLV